MRTYIFSYYEYGKLVKTYRGDLEHRTVLTYDGYISELESIIRFFYGLTKLQFTSLLTGETLTEGNLQYSLA